MNETMKKIFFIVFIGFVGLLGYYWVIVLGYCFCYLITGGAFF
jgi:hypothetical protein